MSSNTNFIKAGEIMKRVIFAGLVTLVSATAMAQEVMDDGSRVVLPLEAQQCDLPSAPPPIPEVPEKADLLAAQKGVKNFQADMEVYRNCIDKDADSPDLSTGNGQAISNAHNYSVDMEERVAAMFNDAVRAYKANLAKD
jgi:hypothetical protein